MGRWITPAASAQRVADMLCYVRRPGSVEYRRPKCVNASRVPDRCRWEIPDDKTEAPKWPFTEPALSEKNVRNIARMAVRHLKLNAHPQQPHYPAIISAAAASAVRRTALNRVWEEEVHAAIERRREGRAKITPPTTPSNKPPVPIQKASLKKTLNPKFRQRPHLLLTSRPWRPRPTGTPSSLPSAASAPSFDCNLSSPSSARPLNARGVPARARQETPGDPASPLHPPCRRAHNLLPALDLLTLDLLISQMHIDTRPPPTG